MTAFSDDFLFGCATSAYQIEGGIENDWEQWARDGRLGPRAPCGRATDHWNRYEEDFDRLVELGAGAYRFSVEWARVEPEPGRYDEDAIQRYVEMVDALRTRGVEPFVTLLHFTHPTWFHERCPWHDLGGEAPERFGAFARRMAEAFGERVRFYTVLNEPNVWIEGAYVAGLIPPRTKSLQAAGAAMAGLLAGHAKAAAALRSVVPGVQIGVAHNHVRFEPSRGAHPFDRVARHYVEHFHNRVFLEGLTTGRLRFGHIPGLRMAHDVPEAVGTLDFVGVNYYARVFVEARLSGFEVFYEDRAGRGVTDLGWEVHPEGLTLALTEAGRHGLPVYVTENGLDDRDDSRRSAYLYDHLQAVLAARRAGTDVRGYFFWSLVDNFEWLEGFVPSFGLYAVDRDTLERTPTNAAELFRTIAKSRRLPEARPAQQTRPGDGRTPVG
ncbi:MAG: family 1 glycosylhydrolase [Deltaproteobacteria bacterium]